MVNFSESLAKHPELQEFMYSLCDGTNETTEQNRFTIGFTDDNNDVTFTTGDTESFQAMYSFSYDFATKLDSDKQAELAEILASYYTDLEVEDFLNEDGTTYDGEKLSNVAIWVAWNVLDDTNGTELNYTDSITREQLIKIMTNFALTSEFVNGNIEQASDTMKSNLGDSDIVDDENYAYVALTANDSGNYYVEVTTGLTSENLHETAKNAELVYVYNLISGQSENVDVDVANIGAGNDVDSTFDTIVMNYTPYQDITGLSINNDLSADANNYEKLIEATSNPNSGMPQDIYEAYQSTIIGYYATRAGVSEALADNEWYSDLTKESLMNLLYDLETGSQSYMNLASLVENLIGANAVDDSEDIDDTDSSDSSSSSDSATQSVKNMISDIVTSNANNKRDDGVYWEGDDEPAMSYEDALKGEDWGEWE